MPDGGKPTSSDTAGKPTSRSSRRAQTLRLEEVPHHRGFNPFILTGFLPPLSTLGCLKSLLYTHNETMNIFTHAVPLAWVLLVGSKFVPWSVKNTSVIVHVLPYLLMTSFMGPWLGSTLYHIFMAHQGGEDTYHKLLAVDMFGIWVNVILAPLTYIFASVIGLGAAAAGLLVALYVLLCLQSLAKAIFARGMLECRGSFLSPWLMLHACGAVRTTRWGGGHPSAVPHLFAVSLLAMVSAVVSAFFLPERWVPGRLDLLGNSHQIMHLAALWANYHIYRAAVLDLAWLTNLFSSFPSAP